MMTTAELCSTARQSLQSPTATLPGSALPLMRTGKAGASPERAVTFRSERGSAAVVRGPVLQHLVANKSFLEEIIDDSLAGRIAWTVAPPARTLGTLILSATGRPFELSLDADAGGWSARRDEPVFPAHFDTLGIGAGRRHRHSILRMIGGSGTPPVQCGLSGIGVRRAVIEVTVTTAMPLLRRANGRCADQGRGRRRVSLAGSAWRNLPRDRRADRRRSQGRSAGAGTGRHAAIGSPFGSRADRMG